MNKKIDTLIIGNNIASFLTATQILKSGFGAIYLRDKRIKASDPYFKFFGPLDLAFIEAWASDLELDSTIFDKDSFVHAPFYLKYKSEQTLCAGLSPYLNFSQICRHFPELYNEFINRLRIEEIDQEKFDQDFMSSVKRLGESLCRYKTFHQVTVNTLRSALPNYIHDIYEIFKKHLRLNKDLQRFASCFRCVYTKTLELTFSDLETIYFFILMLSPRFRFQWQLEKEEQATKTIECLGGSSFEDIVEEFSFSSRRPWAAQLSSFSGVVAPQKIAIFSSNLDKLNIAHNITDLYRCVKLDYALADKLISADYYYFNESSFGGDIVFIRKEISLDGTCQIKMFKQFDDCLKYDFCEKELHQFLLDNQIIDRNDTLLKGKLTNETCMLRNHSVINSGSRINLKFRMGQAGKFESVKGVFYHGPLKKNNLGITQTLLEARDFKTFI
ncbi:hypothetical protein ABMA70_01245 [Halobacteriovorax sp. XZX-3]|uniref:hypothetical protein n=1 Tax=unclassified Halobacteriovorax TaxID=2639665 RepID=UPI000CD12CBB|nr:hypothetical protein [Halobacteriovorax sp. DA5]POB14384.1 hypothetical protein C0Z22_04635 [Halobacteriovorax sp. DA5]